MTESPRDRDARLRRYLLGGLTEPERLRVEEDFFGDDNAFEELRAIEAELAMEYAEDALPPDERRQYEQRFLATGAGRERVEFARALIGRLAGEPRGVEARPAGPRWRWLAAAAAVILALGAVWIARESRREPDPAAAAVDAPGPIQRQAPPEAVPEPPREIMATLVLTPGLVRGQGTLPEVRIGPEVAGVRVRLDFDAAASYADYRIVLRSAEGAELWARAAAASGRPGGGVSLRATIPSRVLPPGDYELTAYGRPATGDLEEAAAAYFRVTAR